MPITFEDSIATIDTEIKKRRGKWTLTSLTSMDYDDVAQILRLHIWKKWHLYDQKKPLVNWLNAIISNQISNLIRNNFSVYSKPCNACEFNQGGDLCEIYGTQCESCPLFLKWCKNKKFAHDIKMPLPIENHQKEVYEKSGEITDVEPAIRELNKKMKLVLRPYEFKIYKWCFIDNLDDEKVVKLLGYQTEVEMARGHKYLKMIRKAISRQARELVYDKDFDI